jgi:hypothetical protein
MLLSLNSTTDRKDCDMASKAEAKTPERGAEHEQLHVFLGKWHAEGESYATGQSTKNPRAAVEKWVSEESYEWLPGRYFVLQRWDAMVGANELKGTGIISHDPETGGFATRTYENHGFVNDYVTRVDGGIWTFDADSNRGRIEFADGGETQKIFWEWRQPGETWLPLCERVATRVG